MADPELPQEILPPDGATRILTAEQIKRWARLIARGDTPMPNELAPDDTDKLVNEVRRLRRQHMVRTIAHAIARDMMREQKLGKEAPPHD